MPDLSALDLARARFALTAGLRAALLWGVAATAWVSASLIVPANASLHRPGTVLHGRDGAVHDGAMLVDPVTLLTLKMLTGLLLTGMSWLLAIPQPLWHGGGSGWLPAAGVAAALLPFVLLGTMFLGRLYQETARQPWMIVGEVTAAEALSVQSVPLLAEGRTMLRCVASVVPGGAERLSRLGTGFLATEVRGVALLGLGHAAVPRWVKEDCRTDR